MEKLVENIRRFYAATLLSSCNTIRMHGHMTYEMSKTHVKLQLTHIYMCMIHILFADVDIFAISLTKSYENNRLLSRTIWNTANTNIARQKHLARNTHVSSILETGQQTFLMRCSSLILITIFKLALYLEISKVNYQDVILKGPLSIMNKRGI